MAKGKIRLVVKSLNKSCGNFRYYPDCPITRAFVLATRAKECVPLEAILSLKSEGYAIEYRGRDCSPLDSIGATHIEEEETTSKK